VRLWLGAGSLHEVNALGGVGSSQARLSLRNFNICHSTQLHKSSTLTTASSNPEHPHLPHPISRCRWSSLSKRLSPAHTLRIEVRSLSQTDSSLPSPGTIIIVGGGVVYRSIVPDCQVIGAGPSVTDLKVVILNTVSFENQTGIYEQLTLDDQLREPSQEMIALVLGHLVDALRVVAHGIHALPASDRVCPHNWMNGGKICADILRSTTLGTVKLIAVLLCALIEDRLCVGGRQPFQELLVSWRQTVIDFVTRRPQRIATGLGQLGQTQDGIVTWDRLKGDIAVPSFFAALFLVTSEALGVQHLGLFGANDRDLVVFTAESAATVGDGMNVQL
jgi:hypothetical protein